MFFYVCSGLSGVVVVFALSKLQDLVTIPSPVSLSILILSLLV
jgi:hypothetical protein